MIEITQRPRYVLLGSNESKWTASENPVVYKFLRKDQSIISVVVGTGLKALVNVSIDLTSDISIGDAIFIESNEYSIGGNVTSITATTIQTDIDYTVDSFGGYINFRKNWRLEISIHNVDGDAALITNKIQYQSSPKGEITIDFSQYIKQFLSALNLFNYDVDQQEDKQMSIGFYIKYNENYTGLVAETVFNDSASPTYITHSAKQIGDVYGQNMAEYVPFPELLEVNQINGAEFCRAVTVGFNSIYFVGSDVLGTNPRIFRIDPVNKVQLFQNTVASELFDIVFVPTNEYLFAISDSTDNTCYRIQASTLDPVDNFLVETSPTGIDYCSSTDEVWVSSRQEVESYNADTKVKNVSISEPGGNITDVIYDNNTDRIFYTDGVLVKTINPIDGSLITSETLSEAINAFRRMISFKNNDGCYLAFPTTLGNVIIVNAQTGKQDSIYNVGDVDCVTFDDESQYLYFHTTSQTLIEVDSISRETIQVFDVSALDTEVNEMVVSNRSIFFAERNDNAYYKLLPPPQLAGFLNQMDKPKIWRNYPFDLSFIFNSDLLGFIVARNVLQFNESNIQIGSSVLNLDNTKSGYANRLLIGDLENETKKIQVFLTNEGATAQYNRTDYNNSQYK